MSTSEDQIATLQGFVDGYADAVETTLATLTDAATPPEARRTLAGALNYVLDLLDIFPDHYKGLGVADDAIVLRLAAKSALQQGAAQARLGKLAAEASAADDFLGELREPLEKYVAKLGDRTVRGRSVKQILDDKVVFDTFANDVRRQVASHKKEAIDPTLSADYHVGELRRMIKHELKKAGL